MLAMQRPSIGFAHHVSLMNNLKPCKPTVEIHHVAAFRRLAMRVTKDRQKHLVGLLLFNQASIMIVGTWFCKS